MLSLCPPVFAVWAEPPGSAPAPVWEGWILPGGAAPPGGTISQQNAAQGHSGTRYLLARCALGRVCSWAAEGCLFTSGSVPLQFYPRPDPSPASPAFISPPSSAPVPHQSCPHPVWCPAPYWLCPHPVWCPHPVLPQLPSSFTHSSSTPSSPLVLPQFPTSSVPIQFFHSSQQVLSQLPIQFPPFPARPAPAAAAFPVLSLLSPSASQEQFLGVARGQTSPCSLTFGQFACAQVRTIPFFPWRWGLFSLGILSVLA